MQGQFEQILSNLSALGTRRLIALALVAVLTLMALALGARYVNRPAFETLYVNLERDDINRIGIVLGEAGIRYDVDSTGTSVLVERGRTSKARMILAEKGLPGSAGSGYELFDKLGSLGLTSFMQEVTRVRVLEGEIARSIQAISGIKAARVHIVQPDPRSFGARNREASASVLVRTNGAPKSKTAFAIRHLVAAAVPQLSTENVTVLDANGRLLAAGEDPSTSMLNNSISIQRMVEEQFRSSIADALTPYLGAMNFRVNVQADVDTDRKQTEETIYDPESRVERSVQVVKTQDNTTQRSASEAASVEQNLPNAEPNTASGPESSQASERREETTNYELNTKKVATVSNGYSVRKVSASIVLNQARLAEVLGGSPTPEQIQERVQQIENVARAAVGFDEKRGDFINVTAVEFVPDAAGEPLAEPGIVDKLFEQLGTMINALAFIIGAFLLIFVGLRPMVKTLITDAQSNADSEALPEPGTFEASLDAPDGGGLEQLAAPDQTGELPMGMEIEDSFGPNVEPSDALQAALDEDTESLFAQLKKSPVERLEALADANEETSVNVLRDWIEKEAA